MRDGVADVRAGRVEREAGVAAAHVATDRTGADHAIVRKRELQVELRALSQRLSGSQEAAALAQAERDASLPGASFSGERVHA